MTRPLRFDRQVFVTGFCLAAGMTTTLWAMLILSWGSQSVPPSRAPLAAAFSLVLFVDLAGTWLMWLLLSQLAALVTFFAQERSCQRP
jgi:hypothetical protein